MDAHCRRQQSEGVELRCGERMGLEDGTKASKRVPKTGAIDAIEQKARLHFKFACMLMRSDRKLKAAKHFQAAATLSQQATAACHFHLGNLNQKVDDAVAETHYQIAVYANPSMAEAWHNLGSLKLRLNENAVALRCFRSAIRLRTDYPEAYFNVATALRRLKMQSDAIEFSWNAILRNRNLLISSKKCEEMRLPSQRMPSIDCGGDVAAKASTTQLTVVCVKWGTKYGVEYVRNLRRGVHKHLSVPHRFICFTDDPISLRGIDGLESRVLLSGWKGWWNKATLFSPEARLSGRILYIDLDTVITGLLDSLLTFRGHFATLATDAFLNEGRVGGLNSSIMLWWCPSTSRDGPYRCGEIYNRLVQLSTEVVGSVVHRFDHWLEMNLANVPRLQDIFPNMFVEYANDCKDGAPPPRSASVVNFPLEPKPHALARLPWIQEHFMGVVRASV